LSIEHAGSPIRFAQHGSESTNEAAENDADSNILLSAVDTTINSCASKINSNIFKGTTAREVETKPVNYSCPGHHNIIITISAVYRCASLVVLIVVDCQVVMGGGMALFVCS
jgi:hypothetical protein